MNVYCSGFPEFKNARVGCFTDQTTMTGEKFHSEKK